jgi:energy-converting hydrogenase B subunit D
MTDVLLAFDLLLSITLITLALAALTSREPRRAVILFIAFGLLLALVWTRLRAPDVALAEAAMGAGLAGALMLAAARRASHALPDQDEPGPQAGEED